MALSLQEERTSVRLENAPTPGRVRLAVPGLQRLMLDAGSRLLTAHPTNARQRSGGSVTQTLAPGEKLSRGSAVTRSCVPSPASTM